MAVAAIEQTFSYSHIVHDDTRQHVFWMQRFIDPGLFPNDLIADYHQSAVPSGFKAFYRFMAEVGIDPLWLNRFIPILLGLVTTGYCFGICSEILPVPSAGFIATVFLNQNLWGHSDLISGTPRAFLYPFFAAFLYYLLRRSLVPLIGSIILLGLFYPPPLLLVAGMSVIRLWDWRNWRFSRDRRDYWIAVVGIITVAAILLPYILASSDFGPTLTLAEAKELPELGAQGRKEFFSAQPRRFWLWSGRSGFFPREWKRLPHQYFLFIFIVGLFLPLLGRFSSRFPLVKKINPRAVTLLPELIAVSTFWYLAAHALLFKLYLPSRFTEHSFRIVGPIAASITLIVVLEAILNFCKEKSHISYKQRQLISVGATGILLVLFISSPVLVETSSRTRLQLNNYKVGNAKPLYRFLRKQPKDILIASLAAEANNIPTHARRSVLIASEYSNPYQMGYYRQFRERMDNLIRAQYSQDIEDVKDFIQKYGIDFWMLNRDAFTGEYFLKNSLLKQFLQQEFKEDPLVRFVTQTRLEMESGNRPILAEFVQKCAVFEMERLVLLEAECIANSSPASAGGSDRESGQAQN
ncbi:MAG: hypothetical protein SW833_11580 [Cyanobacteriota bacterium]|nr:hypothetical protein [Cyanobacteriota bacterium]